MIEVKNLCVKYKNTGKEVLEGISFRAEKGDRIAILGLSGCGKTTLLNSIAGLLSEREIEKKGEVLFMGGAGAAKLRFVLQKPTLLPWRTVFKNISFGLEIEQAEYAEIKKRVSEIINLVGLGGYEDYYPHQLSVGMQQRVNFARALVCRPDILLLDEPFSALDIETKKKIQSEFLDILKKENITSIFVTHNIEEAIFMTDKIIVLSGKPAGIKEIYKNGNLILEQQAFVSSLEFYAD